MQKPSLESPIRVQETLSATDHGANTINYQISKSGTWKTKSNTAWRKLSNSFRVGEAEGDEAAGVHLSRPRNPESITFGARQLFQTNNYGKSRDWCRVSDRMHYIQFNQIVRDAEIANVISSVVREHRLTEGEIEKALLELRIPRAANVARISVGPNPAFRELMPNMR